MDPRLERELRRHHLCFKSSGLIQLHLTLPGVFFVIFMPFHILGIWFRGLLAVAILVGGGYLLYRWFDEAHVVGPRPASVPTAGQAESAANPPAATTTDAAIPDRHFEFHPGWNSLTALLVAGVLLLTWGLFGGLISLAISSLLKPGSVARLGGVGQEPRAERTGIPHDITRPDGSKIRVETYGAPTAPPIVLTHGWGGDSTSFFYPKRDLTDRFRLIVWDEPGLGRSTKPTNNDFSMEKFAADLDAVLGFAGQPAILVGHSIGGMILLTYARVYRATLRAKVAGLALVHTTYKDPVQTTKGAALYSILEKPLIIPMMYVTIALYPLFWSLVWLSYLNGSLHRSTAKSSFAGTESQAQLNFCTAWTPRARPDIVARGMLGMMAFDETATLPGIEVPTLVVVGDLDTTCPAEAGHYMVAKIPGAELATLSPARHMGLIEQHAAFDPILARFSASCFASKGKI